MVIAESHFRAGWAAIGDQIGWMASLVCAVYGIGDVIRHRRITRLTMIVFFCISAGNIIGTFAGVDILGRLLNR
jgi:hypothetical protein